MKQLHPIQLKILQKLLFSPTLRYTDLRPTEEIENNQLDFHLNKLIKSGYVTKLDKGYSLTASGKEYAGRIDTEHSTVKRQGKLGAIIACTRERNGEREFLFYTRLKQPFYGCQGFFTGKIGYGENITETAERELEEETGLSGTAEIIKLTHYRVFHHETSELLEDKYLFLCRIDNPQGILREYYEEGEYYWVKESEIRERITNPFEPMEDFLKQVEAVAVDNSKPSIVEVNQISGKF